MHHQLALVKKICHQSVRPAWSEGNRSCQCLVWKGHTASPPALASAAAQGQASCIHPLIGLGLSYLWIWDWARGGTYGDKRSRNHRVP